MEGEIKGLESQVRKIQRLDAWNSLELRFKLAAGRFINKVGVPLGNEEFASGKFGNSPDHGAFEPRGSAPIFFEAFETNLFQVFIPGFQFIGSRAVRMVEEIR